MIIPLWFLIKNIYDIHALFHNYKMSYNTMKYSNVLRKKSICCLLLFQLHGGKRKYEAYKSVTRVKSIVRDILPQRESATGLFWETTFTQGHNYSLLILYKPLLEDHLFWKTIFYLEERWSLTTGFTVQINNYSWLVD